MLDDFAENAPQRGIRLNQWPLASRPLRSAAGQRHLEEPAFDATLILKSIGQKYGKRCLLPLKQCLCATLTSAQAASRFCL
ncbi:hypothetical protein ACTXQV_71295, partial [Klebsiella pneumoniae]